ncbi:MAG: hypothetical protein ACLRX9_02485 [Streptococcus salivarius]
MAQTPQQYGERLRVYGQKTIRDGRFWVKGLSHLHFLDDEEDMPNAEEVKTRCRSRFCPQAEVNGWLQMVWARLRGYLTVKSIPQAQLITICSSIKAGQERVKVSERASACYLTFQR